MRVWLMALLCCISICVNAEATQAYSVKSETRSADYTIGSIAKQSIEVFVPAGFVLDTSSLPVKKPSDTVELRQLAWQTQRMGNRIRYTIDIDWQIFVAYEVVRDVPLKPLNLVFEKDQEKLRVNIPAEQILLSNLLPHKMQAQHLALYPDIPPQRADLSTLWLSLLFMLCLLLLSLLYIAWYMGWVQLPFEKQMPFRQAWKAIKQQQGAPADSAMQRLAYAVSEYAGYTVTTENIADLFEQKPEISAYQAELIQFYQALQQVFFAGLVPTYSQQSVLKLAKQLSHLEM